MSDEEDLLDQIEGIEEPVMPEPVAQDGLTVPPEQKAATTAAPPNILQSLAIAVAQNPQSLAGIVEGIVRGFMGRGDVDDPTMRRAKMMVEAQDRMMAYAQAAQMVKLYRDIGVPNEEIKMMLKDFTGAASSGDNIPDG